MAWRSRFCTAGSRARFNQVPSVAPRISPDRDAPIGFVAWDLLKDGTRRDKPRLICRKVIGVQEKPDPPTALRADGVALRQICWLCQHQATSTSARLHHDPAFVALGKILAQRPAQPFAEKADGVIIVWNNQGDRGKPRRCRPLHRGEVSHGPTARRAGRCARPARQSDPPTRGAIRPGAQ